MLSSASPWKERRVNLLLGVDAEQSYFASNFSSVANKRTEMDFNPQIITFINYNIFTRHWKAIRWWSCMNLLHHLSCWSCNFSKKNSILEWALISNWKDICIWLITFLSSKVFHMVWTCLVTKLESIPCAVFLFLHLLTLWGSSREKRPWPVVNGDIHKNQAN